MATTLADHTVWGRRRRRRCCCCCWVLVSGVSGENGLSQRVQHHLQRIGWVTECPVADQLCRGLGIVVVEQPGKSVANVPVFVMVIVGISTTTTTAAAVSSHLSRVRQHCSTTSPEWSSSLIHLPGWLAARLVDAASITSATAQRNYFRRWQSFLCHLAAVSPARQRTDRSDVAVYTLGLKIPTLPVAVWRKSRVVGYFKIILWLFL